MSIARPTPKPPGRVASIFVVLWFATVFFDAFPFLSTPRRIIDPVLDKTGLWQGPWNLFAPEPDKINVRVGATIQYADGQVAEWRSPEWQTMGPVRRFMDFREMEWVDGIRLDDNRGAWDAYAQYLARTVVHPTGSRSPAVGVRLTRYWATIPPPSTAVLPAEPYLVFDGARSFHVWEPDTPADSGS